MPSITNRNGSYRIAVSNGYRSDGHKIVHTKTWTPSSDMTPKQTERELQRVALEFENAVKQGQAMSGKTTLAMFADRWLVDYVDKQLAITTTESYRHELRTKIIPALGHMKLDQIKPMHIMAFLDQMGEDGIRIDKKPGAYSPRTVKYMYDILSSLMQTAVYWQVIQTNPCERVKPPASKNLNQQKLKHFTDEQTIVFLSAIESEPLKYQLLANFGVFVGSRRGEVLALTWDDVNLETGEVNIDKQQIYLKSYGYITKDTKTSGSVRLVSIPPSVVTMLRKHRTEQLEQRLRLGGQWEEHNLIFTQWNGAPMHTTTPRQWLGKFIKRHNERIQADDRLSDSEKAARVLPVIPYHGLRHTSATLLISQNIDVKTASARLGHSQASTFTDIYSHFLKSADRKAADTLENLLSRDTKKGHA